MEKESIRPLLVEALELAKKQEAEVLAHYPVTRLEARAARYRRASVEVQLWLADRQWEREEAEEREEVSRTMFETASPITKL
jgi:hypothetical protein